MYESSRTYTFTIDPMAVCPWLRGCVAAGRPVRRGGGPAAGVSAARCRSIGRTWYGRPRRHRDSTPNAKHLCGFPDTVCRRGCRGASAQAAAVLGRQRDQARGRRRAGRLWGAASAARAYRAARESILEDDEYLREAETGPSPSAGSGPGIGAGTLIPASTRTPHA